jgi:MYXO-CTERM domain-containing protein
MAEVDRRTDMRRLILAALAAAAVGSSASAQQTGNDFGVATETQERRSEGQDSDFPWDLLGLLGLAGLLGLRRRGDADGSR